MFVGLRLVLWCLLPLSTLFQLNIWRSVMEITKSPNTEQSSKGKGKTHKSTNRQNQSITGKLGKAQWP